MLYQLSYLSGYLNRRTGDQFRKVIKIISDRISGKGPIHRRPAMAAAWLNQIRPPASKWGPGAKLAGHRLPLSRIHSTANLRSPADTWMPWSVLAAIACSYSAFPSQGLDSDEEPLDAGAAVREKKPHGFWGGISNRTATLGTWQKHSIHQQRNLLREVIQSTS